MEHQQEPPFQRLLISLRKSGKSAKSSEYGSTATRPTSGPLGSVRSFAQRKRVWTWWTPLSWTSRSHCSWGQVARCSTWLIKALSWRPWERNLSSHSTITSIRSFSIRLTTRTGKLGWIIETMLSGYFSCLSSMGLRLWGRVSAAVIGLPNISKRRSVNPNTSKCSVKECLEYYAFNWRSNRTAAHSQRSSLTRSRTSKRDTVHPRPSRTKVSFAL